MDMIMLYTNIKYQVTVRADDFALTTTPRLSWLLRRLIRPKHASTTGVLDFQRCSALYSGLHPQEVRKGRGTEGTPRFSRNSHSRVANAARLA